MHLTHQPIETLRQVDKIIWGRDNFGVLNEKKNSKIKKNVTNKLNMVFWFILFFFSRIVVGFVTYI